MKPTTSLPKLDEHVSVRLDAETLAKVDAVADKVAKEGHRPCRAVAVRILIFRGLKTFETPAASESPAPTTTKGGAA